MRELLAIDRVRDGLAELALLQEREAWIAFLLLRLLAEPERVGGGADAELDQLQLPLFFSAARRSFRGIWREPLRPDELLAIASFCGML